MDTAGLLKFLDKNKNHNHKTLIMGILNVTPDSFFDGGVYLEKNGAVEHGLEMVRQGADIIDIGGESTRPFSDPVSLDEELSRVLPVLESLSGKTKVPISIDTYKSEVARPAIEAGATIVNDISALAFDPAMGPLIAETDVPVIRMHIKGTPKNMQSNPTYDDLIGEITSFFHHKLEIAIKAGIKRDHIIIDPGIGFGKSFKDNLKIIRELHKFSDLGQPILIGTSNKSFIGSILGPSLESRDNGTMATVAAAIMNGANIVRVHNVKAARETATIIDAIKSGRADS